MDILELKELKAEYEREFLLAEAKVSVINDIIAKSEAKAVETECEIPEEEVAETEATDLTTY